MSDYLEQYEHRTPNSKRLYEQARKYMAGGVSHGIRYFAPYPLFIERVDGSRIWDVDGNEYLDLWMGHFALILGHRPPVLNDALQQVANAGLHWGIVHESQIALAQMICEMVPCAERVRFCVSGTEATMYAVRLTRGFTGRRVMVKMEGGWHGGNTDLSVAVKVPFDQPECAGIPPELAQFVRTTPFNDVESAMAVLHDCREDLAGVIVEPVMGAGGLIPADQAFLQALREETARLGALLIFDEVVTGFRLGLGGAQEYFGVVPDLVTLGKIAGGGSNIGVIAGRADVLSLSDPSVPRKKGEGVLTGGGTFSSSPLSMNLGRAMLRHLRDNASEIYPRLNRMGERLRMEMESAFQRAGLTGRTVGVGSLCGAYLPKDTELVARNAGDLLTKTDTARLDNEFRIRMLNRGVYVMHGGGAVSTAHTDEDLDRIIQAVEIAAQEMSSN